MQVGTRTVDVAVQHSARNTTDAKTDSLRSRTGVATCDLVRFSRYFAYGGDVVRFWNCVNTLLRFICGFEIFINVFIVRQRNSVLFVAVA